MTDTRQATTATPDLLGLDLADAVATAASLGFAVNAVRVGTARGPAAVIVGQSPSPGYRLRPQWRIHVLVAERRSSTTST